MAEIFTTAGLVSLLTLAVLEIVLGVDNVIFIAILADKLPKEQQAKARQLGIAVAVISRVILLLALGFLIRQLANDFMVIPFIDAANGGHGVSVRDLILIGGGLFLIGKATKEIHDKLEGLEHGHESGKGEATMRSVLTQIFILDVVFSLDSVITALGIAEEISIMVIAVLIAAVVMVLGANKISEFVAKHPTFKILALAFLILIGFVLVIEGAAEELAHQIHIKNYVYFAMAFAVIIEVINMRYRARSKKPVQLHNQPNLPDSK